VTDPTPLEALPDLTLAEASDRWGVSSRNTLKARAAALGVVLRRESSTRTVWPAEYVALGDRLAEHLQSGGTLASFGPSVTAPTDGSDGVSQTAPFTPGDGSKRPRRSGGLSLMAATDGSDALGALIQLAAAMAPPPPPVDPLTVSRGLADAADLGAWLTTAELAQLLGMAAGTVRGWSTGHRPRPGFELEKRKDGAAVWWRVSDVTD
jgi:hypothetical protein